MRSCPLRREGAVGDHGYYEENWDAITHQGRDVWAYGEDESGHHHERIRKVTTSKINLEKALKEAQRAQAHLEKLLRQTQRFPEEFAVGTVLKFKHVFEDSIVVRQMRSQGMDPTAYDYVALRADNGFWYLTCSGTKRMLWEQLVEFIGDEEVTVMVEGEKV
jgi:hypothetical protein